MSAPPPKEIPFLWGAATSSHQVEGGNDKNDWWEWESQGRIDGGARSGDATEHWTRYREDIRLAAELGLNTYRFSIEWSRIEPAPGEWNEQALEWYANLITECESHGLLPMLTLHHFTSPAWFAKLGGFTHKDAPTRFAAFVKKVAQTLGPRVPLWCTLNEPMVLVTGTYLGQFMPPAQYSPSLASQACAGLLKSHVLAYDLLHSEIKTRQGPWAHVPLQVGIAHNMLDFMPDRPWHWIEALLAKTFWRFYNRAWLDAITGKKQNFGVIGFVPAPPQVLEAHGRKTADFIGVNYYTKAYVQWRPRDAGEKRPADLPLGLVFARRKEPASDVEWAIHPKGLGKMLRTASRYGLPIYVTENGIADRKDALRSEYLFTHLKEIAKAIAHGIDIRGYYYWSLLDNFEWIKGFGPRFGLYQVDYDTLTRHRTRSADFYKKLITAHQDRRRMLPDLELFRQD